MSETAVERLARLADEADAKGQRHTAAAMRKYTTSEEEAASFINMMGLVGKAARAIRDREPSP